jgi:predicted Zn-dependent peptidase
MHHSLHTLKSGLTLLTIPMPSVKSVTVLALVKAGSRYESPRDQGLAHFFEHMVFKGTANYPTAQLLAEAVDAVGADYNAYTSKEYTGFYVHVASEHFKLALDVVSDMLLTPKLPADELEKEKGVIVEEINMYLDNPMRHIGDLFEGMFYRGSGLEHQIIGTKETVTAFKQADFTRFLHDWYGLSNMVVVVAGDATLLKDAGLEDQLTEAFSKGDAATRAPRPDHQSHWSKQPVSQERLHLEHKATEQAHFILGFPGISRHDEDRYAASLVSTALGSSMSSRLFAEVREKRGLCYYVHSDFDTYHDGGSFGASAGVDPTRVDEALEVTLAECLKLIEGGAQLLTADELQRAKDHVAGKMVLGLEDSQSVASYYGMKQLLQGKIETPEQVLKRLRAVTLDECHRVATRLMQPDQVRLALIGPFEDKERFAKLIK